VNSCSSEIIRNNNNNKKERIIFMAEVTLSSMTKLFNAPPKFSPLLYFGADVNSHCYIYHPIYIHRVGCLIVTQAQKRESQEPKIRGARRHKNRKEEESEKILQSHGK
jgi:hypothetical protein